MRIFLIPGNTVRGVEWRHMCLRLPPCRRGSPPALESEPADHPSNVMVASSGEVKRADFGIAKAANAQSGTQAGVVKGKAGYLAPEQVRGAEVDQRADLFLIGQAPSSWRVFVIPRKSSRDGTDNAPALCRLGIQRTTRTSRVSG